MHSPLLVSRRLPCGYVVLGVLFLLWASVATAQAPPPTVTAISPTQGAQGTTVTVTVNGTGFIGASANAVGVSLAPGTGITVLTSTFLVQSATQLSVQVQVAPTAPLGLQTLQVNFTSVSGPFSLPAPTLFQVVAAPPVLASASPGRLSQGARDIRLTLNGQNFRAPLTVVISPPLPSVSASQVSQQATDIQVQQVSAVSSSLILVVINVANAAALGLRAVDVINSDGSNTGLAGRALPGSGTSQPLLISGRTSLGAPLDVQTLAILHPRDGTIATQGDELYAQAILAGVGTGTITGLWLWDGNVFEQFAVPMAAGERVALKTMRSLPTTFLGVHALELRITGPGQVQSRTVSVIINPGDWKLGRLLFPSPSAGFLADVQPTLRWAIIPGAAKYQVGFSTRPYFSAIERWYDVEGTEWRVPEDVWRKLPEGELYWTVRTVEISGDTREPLPMRRMTRFRAGVLEPRGAAPQRAATGGLLLEWAGVSAPSVYRVTVSRDAAVRDIVKRFLTRDPRLDLRAVLSDLRPGSTYYWQVEAFTPSGRSLVVGPPQSFVAPALSGAIVNHGFTALVASRVAVAPPQLGQQISSRKPGPNDKVSSDRPPIMISFKIPVSAADVVLEVDDLDVTAMAKIEPQQVNYTPVFTLPEGEHAIRVAVGKDSESWKFSVSGKAAAPAPMGTIPGTDAEAEPTASPSASAAAAGKEGVPPPMREASMQLSSNTQWISGSEADTVAIGMASRTAFQNGPWRVESNGTGLLNALVNPEPRTARGRVNDYVFRLAYDQPRWGAAVRFGILAPALYTDSEFVTTGTVREGVEPMLRTPAGTFAFYQNTRDAALGGGSGVGFHQEILGASYDAPLPKNRATFRLMWLSAADRGAPTKICFDTFGNPSPCGSALSTPASGDVYGGLLRVPLGRDWQWLSEYSWSYINPDISNPTSGRLFGRAWRTGIGGSWRNTRASFSFRDVGTNFASPTNPSFSKSSSPGRQALDTGLWQATRLGNFSLLYQYLRSDLNRADRPQQSQHNLKGGWSKNVRPTTVVGLGADYQRVFTGDLPPAVLLLPPDVQLAMRADRRNLGANAFVSHTVGTVSMSATGTRAWLRDRLNTKANTITSGLILGGNWNARSWFALNSNFSVTWIAADKSAAGLTRSVSTYIQPMLTWQRTGLTLIPLVSVMQTRTQLASGAFSSNNTTWQALGRLQWRMPGRLQFSTISLEAGHTRTRDNVLGTEKNSPRFVLLWTLVWGRSWL